jgi:hypothetical protein
MSWANVPETNVSRPSSVTFPVILPYGSIKHEIPVLAARTRLIRFSTALKTHCESIW